MRSASRSGPEILWSTLLCRKVVAPKPARWRSLAGRLVGLRLVQVTLAVGVLVAGLIGFDVLKNPSDAAYETLRLFIFHTNFKEHFHDGKIPLPLDIARFVAPALTAFATLELVSLSLRRWNVRRWRGHTVVCGLGTKSLPLVEGLRAQGQQVVVLERDEENPLLPAARECGALVMIGDGTQQATLRRTGIAGAHRLLATCDADGTNAAVAMAAYAAIDASGRSKEDPLVCMAHVVSVEFRDLLSTLRFAHVTDDAFHLRFFSMHENAARLLFVDHLGPALARRRDPARAPWVWIVGFGDTGEAVARRLLASPGSASESPVRLTIVDRHAECLVRSFLQRHPAIEREGLGRIEPLEAELADGADLATRLRGDGKDARGAGSSAGAHPDAVVVCLWDEWKSLTFGLAVARAFPEGGPRVYVRTPLSGVRDALEDPALADVGERIRAFGVVPECCGVTWVLEEGLDGLAKAAHAVYRAKYAGSHPGKPNPDWEALSEDKRDSNRQQIDQIPAKLAAVGMRPVPLEVLPDPRAPSPFTETQRAALARIEHARWCAERFMAGWALGDDDAPRKTNPHLVPWEGLDERVQGYDFSVVDEMSRTLSLLDIGIAVDPPPPSPQAAPARAPGAPA